MGVGLLDSQPLLPQAAPAAVAVPQSHKRCRPRSACRGAQETKTTPTKKVKKEEEEMSSPEKAALQKAGPMPPYVDKVLEKLDEIAGGASLPDWLMKTIEKLTPAAWCEYYNATYKATPGMNYLTERELTDISKKDESVPCCLRLPQLGIHPMTGNAGFVENPTMRLLCAHVLTSGFLTDADVVQGVEKLASRPPSTKEHAAALDMVHPFDGKKSNPLAPMFSVFHTKGWKRTLAANLVVALVKECGLKDDLPPAGVASLANIHSVLRPVRHLREAVERSRAITISATIFRRPVNAFNHLHQLRLLGIEGDQGADQHVEAMDNNQLMQIFEIGPTEALAAKNLAFHTTPYMTSTLARLVGDFGMHNRWGPVHHAALASELLCTGRGPRGYNAVWTKATTNTADTLNLMADRIDKNWRGAHKACRKTMTVEA